MTHMPCVSVVIPCYNQAQYLGEAIQSALDQSYRDFEIIVVDDGSTDNTSQVIASFGDAIRYVRQANRGLAGARNTGIQAARGEFIGLLDSDDMWLPDYLAAMIQAFGDDRTIGAVYSGWHYIDAAGKMLPRTNIHIFPRDQVHHAMTSMNFVVPSGVVVRRTCFEKLGLFDETFGQAQGCEDWDMWLRVLRDYAMVGVPQALVKYRTHGENMSSRLEQMYASLVHVAGNHFGSETGDPTEWTQDKQLAYAGIYFWRTIANYQRQQPDLAAESFRRACRISPHLVTSIDTYYSLLFAELPFGYVGDVERIDLNRNAQRLVELLNGIFTDPQIPAQLRSNRRRAMGVAYFQIGLLYYGRRDLAHTLRALAHAARYLPTLVGNRQWATTFAKAMLGRRLLNLLLELKQSFALRM